MNQQHWPPSEIHLRKCGGCPNWNCNGIKKFQMLFEQNVASNVTRNQEPKHVKHIPILMHSDVFWPILMHSDLSWRILTHPNTFWLILTHPHPSWTLAHTLACMYTPAHLTGTHKNLLNQRLKKSEKFRKGLIFMMRKKSTAEKNSLKSRLRRWGD